MDSVSQQIEQIDALDLEDDKARIATTPLLQTFPVPRELRDQIYSYLLCHEYVKEAAYSKRAHSQRNEVMKLLSWVWSGY